MKVVPTGENLQVISVRHQLFYNLIYLFWLLRLTPTLTKNYVTVHATIKQLAQITLIPYQTRFFGMLKIVAVTFRNLSINRLLDPHQFIN